MLELFFQNSKKSRIFDNEYFNIDVRKLIICKQHFLFYCCIADFLFIFLHSNTLGTGKFGLRRIIE